MKLGIAYWILATSLISSQAQAAAVPELVSQLRQGMTWIQGAVDTPSACSTQDDWYLRRFWLRLRPKATFTLSAVKLTLVPEVELLLERGYPDGWVTYKP